MVDSGAQDIKQPCSMCFEVCALELALPPQATHMAKFGVIVGGQ